MGTIIDGVPIDADLHDPGSGLISYRAWVDRNGRAGRSNDLNTKDYLGAVLAAQQDRNERRQRVSDALEGRDPDRIAQARRRARAALVLR